eukprot:1160674-Pelagomonas_calceolata.AAC.3
MPGISKREKLPLDKKQIQFSSRSLIAKVPNRPAVDITAPVPFQSNPNLQLKVADWKSWTYSDGSCQIQDGKTVIGAVEPNGAGITHTIGRAELAAIAAALTHEHTQTLPQKKHRHHVQGDVQKTISNLARTSQVSNHAIPPYLIDRSIPDQARCTSSRPDAILVTPCPTNPNRPPTPPSHWVLHSMGPPGGHIHLIEIKYSEGTRHGAQLEAKQQQHSELCKQVQGAEITLHTTILGVGKI